jgi:hypothetical protein
MDTYMKLPKFRWTSTTSLAPLTIFTYAGKKDNETEHLIRGFLL